MPEVYTSNSGLDFIILSKEGKQCIIQFLETGSTRKANIDNIKVGKVRDLYAVSTYGEGYDGEFKKNSYWKQAKQLWRNMMKRCYCEKDTRGYYGEVTVCARWKCFSNFLEDLPKLENFKAWLEGQNTNATKYNLDKDFKVKGCKIYSLDTTMFVEESLNKADGATRGKPFTKKKRVGKA